MIIDTTDIEYCTQHTRGNALRLSVVGDVRKKSNAHLCKLC
jgi:hypothetical protein